MFLVETTFIRLKGSDYFQMDKGVESIWLKKEKKMAHWLPPTNVEMSDWNIVVIKHNGKTIEKFLGYSLHDRDYRISSQIEYYDSESKTGRTLSGSEYRFLGEPGQLHPRAQYIFNMLEQHDDVEIKLKYEMPDES